MMGAIFVPARKLLLLLGADAYPHLHAVEPAPDPVPAMRLHGDRGDGAHQETGANALSRL